LNVTIEHSSDLNFERPAVAPAFFCIIFEANPFIPASQNKVHGTGVIAEPGTSPFVVGAGNENT
jgi:hypothetical protein